MEYLGALAERYPLAVLAWTALRVALVLAGAWVLVLVSRRLLNRWEQRLVNRATGDASDAVKTEAAKRVETLTRLLRQAVIILIWSLAILMVLHELGVAIGPVLASAGILGLAVGFGAQNLVRDVISGFFLITENQIRVGDVATINGIGGAVEAINLRTVVLRDLTGTVHIVPNGSITQLSNQTKDWSAYAFTIGVAYKEDTDRVVDLLREVGRELREDPQFGALMLEEVEIFGVDDFAASAVNIRGRIKTRPGQQWRLGREYRRRVKHAFDRAGIEIPFPHQTLTFGNASPPIDVKLANRAAPKQRAPARRKPASAETPS